MKEEGRVAGFAFEGENALMAADMIGKMAEYLSGPNSFPGFLAWIDQQLVAGPPCPDCGIAHGPEADAIRTNLESIKTAISNALDGPPPWRQ
jgi:hypothetical protein